MSRPHRSRQISPCRRHRHGSRYGPRARCGEPPGAYRTVQLNRRRRFWCQRSVRHASDIESSNPIGRTRRRQAQIVGCDYQRVKASVHPQKCETTTARHANAWLSPGRRQAARRTPRVGTLAGSNAMCRRPSTGGWRVPRFEYVPAKQAPKHRHRAQIRSASRVCEHAAQESFLNSKKVQLQQRRRPLSGSGGVVISRAGQEAPHPHSLNPHT